MSGDAPRDPVPPYDVSRFRTQPLGGRDHLVETARFARPTELGDATTDFLDALPDYLGVRRLKGLAAAIAKAAAGGKRVLWGMGGHVIKVGLAPLLLDLHARGFAHGFVFNGASAIHDAEIALCGSTSEDVGGGLFEGTYGNADETGALLAEAARSAAASKIGFGAALGAALLAKDPAHPQLSLLCAAAQHGIPLTIHVAVGTDTVHMHPACDGADLGAATHADFLRLTSLVDGLDEGVYVNVGSAVLLPEVFMKAVAIVHNVDPERRVRITTGNLDMLRHYRPRVNVIERPAVEGFDIAGQHEYTLPLLRMAILAAAKELAS